VGEERGLARQDTDNKIDRKIKPQNSSSFENVM
jgi:hypothetical protein